MIKSSIDRALYAVSRFDKKVFPACPNSKRPLVSSWQEKATNRRDEIIPLFENFPAAMLGMPTGPANRISVVDIDCKNDIDGFCELRRANIFFPKTAAVRTPSGGQHLYFDTGFVKFPNSVSKIAQGVDFRGHGGYVIMPPSISVAGQYEWIRSPEETILAKLDPTVLKISDKKPANVSGGRSSCGYQGRVNSDWIFELVHEGCRNQEMARRAGHLLKRYNASKALNIFERINATCCRPPLEFRELITIFHSIAKREGR